MGERRTSVASVSNMIFRIKAKIFQENHFEKMNSSQYFIQSVYRSVLVLMGHSGLLISHNWVIYGSMGLRLFYIKLRVTQFNIKKWVSSDASK